MSCLRYLEQFRMTKARRRILVALGLVAVPALLVAPQMVSETTAVTSYIANTIFSSNLHEVVPARFFRSAEMSRAELQKTIQQRGIKTVIDLRLDQDAPDSTGLSESAAAAAAGASYLHLPFSSARADQLDQIAKLLAAYDTAALPILVHCSSGTHRSGVAAALWLMTKEDRSYDEAMSQLTPKYGFFRFERDLKSFFQGAPTLDMIFSQYRDAASKVSEGAPLSLKSWVAAQIEKPAPAAKPE